MSDVSMPYGDSVAAGGLSQGYAQGLTGQAGPYVQQSNWGQGVFVPQATYSGYTGPIAAYGPQVQLAVPTAQVAMAAPGLSQQFSAPIGQPVSVQVLHDPLQPSQSISMPQMPVAVSQPIAQIVPTPQPSQPARVVQAPRPPAASQPAEYATKPAPNVSRIVPPMIPCDPCKATGGRAAGSVVLGLLSIVGSVIPVLGLLFAIIATYLANSYIHNGGESGAAVAGKVFAVFGFIMSIAFIALIALFVGYVAGMGAIDMAGFDPVSYFNSTPIAQYIQLPPMPM